MVDATDRAFGHHTQGIGYEPTYSGATSCFRPYSRDLEGVDIVALGVPHDRSVTNRPGCRFGLRGRGLDECCLGRWALVLGF